MSETVVYACDVCHEPAVVRLTLARLPAERPETVDLCEACARGLSVEYGASGTLRWAVRWPEPPREDAR